MKSLYLVRHGKASWRHQAVNDAERPLKKKGVEEAHLMAQHLMAKDAHPDLIITSIAKRAQQTADIFREQLALGEKKVISSNSLYNSSAEEMLALTLGLDDSLDVVMFIGHDPSLANFASFLGKKVFEKIPTAGVVEIVFATDHWNKITEHSGQIQFSISPKMMI